MPITVAPTVSSNADVFRNIVDYRAQKKKEILDYLISQQAYATDPQVIKQQWMALRSQYDILAQMDKDLTDIRQGYQRSIDGVLKNIVAGQAAVGAAGIAAGAKNYSTNVEERGRLLDASAAADKAGASAAASISDNINVDANNVGSKQQFKQMLSDIWLKAKPEYDKLASLNNGDIAQAKFRAALWNSVKNAQSIAGQSAPDVATISEGELSGIYHEQFGGLNPLDDVEVESIKQNFISNAPTGGSRTTATITAPTWEQQVGSVGGEAKARDVALKNKLSVEQIKNPNIKYINDDGSLTDLGKQEQEKWKSASRDEVMFYLDSANIDKLIAREKLASNVEAKAAELRGEKKQASFADLEQQAVIEYNRLYGSKKAKEMIAEAERKKSFFEGRNLSNNAVLHQMLVNAISLTQNGHALTESDLKELSRGAKPANIPEVVQPIEEQVVPRQVIQDLIASGIAKVNTEYDADGVPIVTIQAKDNNGNIINLKASEQNIQERPIEQQTPQVGIESATREAQASQFVSQNAGANVHVATTPQRIPLPFDGGGPTGIPTTPSYPTVLHPRGMFSEIPVEEQPVSSGVSSLGPGGRTPVPISSTSSLDEEKYSSPELKQLSDDIQKYAGKKYSQLSQEEQAHLDDVANKLVKLHAQELRKPASPEVDNSLYEIGSIASKIQEMDDTNDYLAPHIQETVDKAMKVIKGKGHASVREPKKEEELKSPSTAKKELILNSITEGAVKASEVFNKSQTEDKPIEVSDKSINQGKLDALKAIATAPVQLQGSELDDALKKVAGSSWDIPSERQKYRTFYTTFSVLK